LKLIVQKSKMQKTKRLLILTCFLTQAFMGFSQTKTEEVFFIGENQAEYDKLIIKYKTPLLTVTGQDVDKAFLQWTDLLTSLEQYSEKQGMDIKGVKIWLNVFWNEKGEVDHFTFYPKPNSKNLDYEKFRGIVKSFLDQYTKLGMASKDSYSHYGTANFPIFAKLNGAN
jgi:hypothetical protein